MSRLFWTLVGALVVLTFLHAVEGEAFRALWSAAVAFCCGGMANALEVSR